MVGNQDVGTDLPQVGSTEMGAGPSLDFVQRVLLMYLPHAMATKGFRQNAVLASPHRQ